MDEFVWQYLRIKRAIVSGTGYRVRIEVDTDHVSTADFFHYKGEIAAAAAHIKAAFGWLLPQHEVAEKRAGQAKVRWKYILCDGQFDAVLLNRVRLALQIIGQFRYSIVDRDLCCGHRVCCAVQVFVSISIRTICKTISRGWYLLPRVVLLIIPVSQRAELVCASIKFCHSAFSSR